MKQTIIVVILVFKLYGSLASELVPIAEKLISLCSNGSTISTVSEDGRYGLSLEPFYRSLFYAVSHRNNSIGRSLNNSSDLQITCSYRFDSFTRQLFVELFLLSENNLLYNSGEVDITTSITEAVPNSSALFDGGVEQQRLIFRGLMGDRLRNLLNSKDLPDMLFRLKRYRIAGSNGNSLNWREQILVDRLEAILGIRSDQRAEAELRFDSTGTLVISAGSERQIASSILPVVQQQKYSERRGYLTPVNNGMTVGFERAEPVVDLELNIIDRIEHYFKDSYPEMFLDFSPDALMNLFPEPDLSTIMIGGVKELPEGEADVRYHWVTPRRWIGALGTLFKSGRRFELSCNVSELIQDPHAPYRFWAVVKQDWKTMDLAGLERYHDVGFLLVNFDFSPDGVMENVQFFYRLWFYAYPFRIGGERPDLRGAKIRRDVDLGLKGIAGVDSSLKDEVKKAIFFSLAL